MPRAPAPDPIRRLSALRATRTGRVLQGALVGAVALLVGASAVQRARSVVHRMPLYRLGPSSLAFVDLPATADERMRADLVAWTRERWPADPARRPSLFHPSLDRRLREILVGNPMVRDVLDVDVRFPGDVRVRATLRTPLARFVARMPDRRGSTASFTLPVDGDGVVLHPDTYAGFLTEHRAVLVRGVEALCPGIGLRWADSKEQVAEGLSAARVANRLNQEFLGLGAPKVEEVDVSGFPATPRTRMKGEVVFVLSDGRTVQWGRTERDLHGVTREDGYDTKRDRLMDLLATRGVRDRRPLDVRFPPSLRDVSLRADE